MLLAASSVVLLLEGIASSPRLAEPILILANLSPICVAGTTQDVSTCLPEVSEAQISRAGTPFLRKDRGRFIADQVVVLGQFPREKVVGAQGDTTPKDVSKCVGSGAQSVRALCNLLNSERQSALSVPIDSRSLILANVHDLFPAGRGQERYNATIEAAFRDPAREIARWRLTYGDLAYFLIGQITNRNYLPYRAGQAYVAVCGVSAFPENARDVQRRWGKVTQRDLVRSLRRDALDPDTPDRVFGALRRLNMWARADAIEVVIQLLKRIGGAPSKKCRDVQLTGASLGGMRIRFLYDALLALSDVQSEALDEACKGAALKLSNSEENDISYDEAALGILNRLSENKPKYWYVCVTLAKSRARAGRAMISDFQSWVRELEGQAN